MNFDILAVWQGQKGNYCDECEYKQTHLSYVPYGESSAELIAETCVLVDDVTMPDTWCPAYDDLKKGDTA